VTDPDENADEKAAEAEAQPVRPPATQDLGVDAALARLADTHGRPAAEHVEVFEDVHRRLQDTLGSLDGEI
jgi:hypothetical protein